MVLSTLRYILLVHKSASLYFTSIRLLTCCIVRTGRHNIILLIWVNSSYIYVYFSSISVPDCTTAIQILLFYLYDFILHLFWSTQMFWLLFSRLSYFRSILLCFLFYNFCFHFRFLLVQVPFSLWWIHQSDNFLRAAPLCLMRLEGPTSSHFETWPLSLQRNPYECGLSCRPEQTSLQ